MKFVTLSIIKDHSVSCLNRGEDGVPKTTMFGGTRRSVISSQNQKFTLLHSELFQDMKPRYEITWPTRRIDIFFSDTLPKHCDDPDRIDALNNLAKKAFGKPKMMHKITTYEMSNFVVKVLDWAKDKSNDELRDLARIVAKKDKPGDKKAKTDEELAEDQKKAEVRDVFAVAKIYDKPKAIDVAAQGRMGDPSNPSSRVDSSLYMAYAISTHEVSIQQDFFTAVDALIAEAQEEAGAGHLDNLDYTTGTYFHFSAIDIDSFRKKLEYMEDPAERHQALVDYVKAHVIESCATSSQSRQHSMASNPLPDAVMVEIRDDKRFFSYMNAFEKAIAADADGGYAHPSVVALRDFVMKGYRIFDLLKPATRLWLTTMPDVQFTDGETVNCENLSELIERLVAELD